MGTIRKEEENQRRGKLFSVCDKIPWPRPLYKKKFISDLQFQVRVHDHCGRDHWSRSVVMEPERIWKLVAYLQEEDEQAHWDSTSLLNLLASRLCSDTSPPTRMYLLILSKEFYQIGTKNSNIWAHILILIQTTTMHSVTPLGLWSHHIIQWI